MAEFVVPVSNGKKIKDSLTRQDMQNIRGLHRKGLAERQERERVLLSDFQRLSVREHKQDSENEHAPPRFTESK